MVSRTKLAVLMGSVVLLTALLALGLAVVSAQGSGVDLVIYKWSSPPAPGPAIAGEELFYHIEVYNSGLTTATNVLVTDTLPYGVSYIDDTDDCTYNSGLHRLVCDLGTVERYEYREFDIKVRVDPWAVMEEFDGTIVLENSAVVGSSEEDDDPSDNTANHSIFVEDSADLTVIKMSKPDTHVRAGELFTYTIYVENLGPSVARFIGMRDELLSSGAFEIVDYWTDRDDYDTVECFLESTEPGISNTLFCMNWLLEPKGLMPLDMGEEFPFDTGRWTINVVLRANETQDVNDVAQVFPLDGSEEGYPWVGTPDLDWSNNTAEDFIYVTDVADLSLSKEITCFGGCVAGSPAYFDLIVSNGGPSTAENVVVEDLLPSGVTVVSVSGDGACTTGIPGDPFAPLTCNLGNIPPDESRSLNVEVQIDPDYVDAELPSDFRQLENDAWVYSDIFDPDNSDNRDHEIVQVYTWSELYLSKWGSGPPWDPDYAVAGEEMEYHIRVRNLGPSTAHNFHFVDPLPSEVTFLEYSIEQGTGTCFYHDPLPFPFSGSGVHCYLDDIQPGGVNVVHLKVLVNPDITQGFCNSIPDGAWFADSYVEVTQSELEWCSDLESQADLSIQKTSEPMKIYPGEQKLYHIEVTNNGPANAPDVIVTDTLPLSVTYEIDNGNCDLVGQNPDVLECYLGNMMPGETKAFDVWALVSRDASPGEITNEAHVVMGGEVGGYDPNEENNWAYATNLVLEPTVADLSLEKWWGEAPPDWFQGGPYGPEDCYLYDEGMNLYGIRAGCPLTFSLTISNTGPLLAENVVVEDAMPAGVTVEGVGPSQGSCTTGIPGDPAAPLTCNLGNIPRDEGATIEVFVRTDADLPWGEHLENDAVVSSDIPDPDNGNNRAHVLIFVEPFSYLYLDKEGPTEIMAGEQIEYWINLRNEGPSTAQDVHLEDELPGGVSLLGAEVMIGDGWCAPDSTLCSLGDMEPWDNRAVRVRGYVEAWLEAETVITNTARAWAESPYFQPVPGQPISDTVETLVHSAADLSIHKSADPYKVYAGEQVRYDVSVSNNGPSVAHNVVVTDTLDPGVEYEIDTSGCTPAGVDGAGVMLGSTTYGDPSLFSLDLGTAAPTFRGSLPYYTGADIEYDAVSGKLYASMGWDWGDGPQLHTIDPETGGSLGFVELDAPCALPALEVAGSTLYATCHTGGHGGDSDLVTVDPTTGHVTYIGPTNRFRIHGLAYDEEAGIMYGVTYHDEDAGDLVSIDLGTGAASTVCSTYREDITGLDFGPGGILYAAIGGDWGTSRDLLTIDTETCDMTVVGQTGLSIMGLTWTGGDTGALKCGLGDIPPGETRNFSIWARVRPDTLGMINNRVDVTSDTEDPNPGNDWDTEANLVLGKADLKVTKFGKPDGQVRAGDELEYWVVVDNLGPGYAHDVVLYDLISSDGEFALWWGEEDGDGEDYSCQVTGCYNDDGYYICDGDARLTCRLNNPLPVMTPDSAGRWLLKVWVEAHENQSINNLARVVGRDYDPDLSNNEAIAEHDITAVADLDLEKEAWGDVLVGCDGYTEQWENEVAAGGTLTYTLEIYNEGPSEAENVVVEDWGLSPFLDIVDVECEKDDSWRECSCNLSGLGELGDTDRHLVCYLGEIDEDDEDVITISAHIPSDVSEGTRLVNDARVYSDVFDDDNGDNLDSNWTYVGRWADLAVEKTQEPEIALPGWDITYTVTVTNLGLSDVEGVFISDTIPAQVLNPTWTCCASGGECDVPCEVPVCPPGECPWPETGLFAQADIPAGEWVIYTIEGTLDVWPCGPFTNTVELVPPQSLLHPEVDIDPCDENNVAEAVNDPFCHFDPLVLKVYPGSDSPP